MEGTIHGIRTEVGILDIVTGTMTGGDSDTVVGIGMVAITATVDTTTPMDITDTPITADMLTRTVTLMNPIVVILEHSCVSGKSVS
jgi:hypothetical protein